MFVAFLNLIVDIPFAAMGLVVGVTHRAPSMWLKLCAAWNPRGPCDCSYRITRARCVAAAC